MKGWLIVNGFLNSDKYKELYALLLSSAKKRGVALELKRGDCLLSCVEEDKEKTDLPDFALFWDKDISLGLRLEQMGIPLFNSVSAVEICDKKTRTAIALARANIPTPKTFLAPKTFEGVGYTRLDFLDEAERLLGYPMVIKEDCGSFGFQVYLANDRTQAEEIFRSLSGKECVLQEFIKESRGRDLRVNVVDGKAVSAILRENEKDFRSNITGGGVAKKYELTEEIETLAVRATNACGLDFAGVDILFGKNGFLVCEVNSNPHFKSTLDCTGLNLSENILDCVLQKLQSKGR